MRNLRYAVFGFLLVLVGCIGHRSFYKEVNAVHSPTAYAKGVLQHHNVIGTEIVALRNDPTVSEASKAKLLDAYRASVCSEAERSQSISTMSCRDGASWELDGAVAAYEALANAQTEEEMQAAADTVVKLIADLVGLIAGVR